MELKYSAALWRPLGTQTEPSIGRPRVLIMHTMVGNLAGTDAMFHRDGYTGTESTFGIGGPWETPNLDGKVYQWQSLDRCADAQWDGNAYATSVETADGGNPTHPWTVKQVSAIVDLAVWWCRQTGNPPVLVSSAAGAGIGYHSQFSVWNRSAHTCPGGVRITQLRTQVIPLIVHALKPPPVTLPPVTPPPATTYTLKRYLKRTDPMTQGTDVAASQRKVGCADDGWFGDITKEHVVTWQHVHGLLADGIIGPDTCHSFGWVWGG
jgi:hypothetical protein